MFSPDGTLISASAAPHCGDKEGYRGDYNGGVCPGDCGPGLWKAAGSEVWFSDEWPGGQSPTHILLVYLGG